MPRNIPSLKDDSQAMESITQFRKELDEHLEHAIEAHEFKMVYIGIATLAVFASVIYLAWKF
jgi:hypothetical protein